MSCTAATVSSPSASAIQSSMTTSAVASTGGRAVCSATQGSLLSCISARVSGSIGVLPIVCGPAARSGGRDARLPATRSTVRGESDATSTGDSPSTPRSCRSSGQPALPLPLLLPPPKLPCTPQRPPVVGESITRWPTPNGSQAICSRALPSTGPAACMLEALPCSAYGSSAVVDVNGCWIASSTRRSSSSTACGDIPSSSSSSGCFATSIKVSTSGAVHEAAHLSTMARHVIRSPRQRCRPGWRLETTLSSSETWMLI
mmetsp:Transcript_4653/g.12389  ORF Transcript_4653/g.12389 Transcript_4653/m.12389 type:complete len:259 (+) Transcript_4653:448-1224(+)